MSEQPAENPPAAPDPAAGAGGSSRFRFRVAAVAVLVVVLVVVGWLVVRDNGSSSDADAVPAKAVSADELAGFASAGSPIYWLGPRANSVYELKQDANGTFVRYLPDSDAVGSDALYPTVATYPFPGAYAALVKVAKDNGETPVDIAGGGIAVPAKGHPDSVHAAYPGVDFQVEVFDPTPGAAARAVQTGKLVAVGSTAASGSSGASDSDEKSAVTAGELAALPAAVGHSVYWVGARKNVTYELTKKSDGSIVLRYLPTGADVGTSDPYLAVATYPFSKPVAALENLARSKGLTAVKVPGGGIAVIDPGLPRNIHLAFPGEDYQIEVFDPSAAEVERLVRTGKVSPIR